jgi:hypothetical protein
VKAQLKKRREDIELQLERMLGRKLDLKNFRAVSAAAMLLLPDSWSKGICMRDALHRGLQPLIVIAYFIAAGF